MQVLVLFFGITRDITGRSSESLDLTDGASVESLYERYAAQFPALRAMGPSLVLAVNQDFADHSRMLADQDEVAFLPPVSGGSTPDPQSGGLTAAPADAPIVELTRAPIDASAVAKRLLRGADGAVVVFEGVVRDNSHGRATLFLEYECYEAMALRVMRRLADELRAEFEIDRVALLHRLGRLEIGENSVAVVVTAAHRKPAFAACLEGINRLKRLVPIWKKEHFADGAVWVDGAWDDAVTGAASAPSNS